MLVELRLVEQRHRAVLEVLDGVSVTEVALRCGVTRHVDTTRPRVEPYFRGALSVADDARRVGDYGG